MFWNGKDKEYNKIEEFVKLIVKECVKIAEQYGTPDAFRIVDEINKVMLNIHPKFGVEE